MTDSTWLDEVEPPVPPSFRPWLRPPGEEMEPWARPPAEWLEEAAFTALGRALSPGNRERGGAFDLLAADAFVTWAAEAMLDDDDAEHRLRALACRLGGAPAPG